MSKKKRREQERRRAEFIATFVAAAKQEPLRKGLARAIKDSARKPTT